MPIVEIFGGNGEDMFNVFKLSYSIDTDFIVYAGNGADMITTGRGNDVIYGGKQNDIIRAGRGDDLIFAGNHDDIVYASSGNDRVYGGAGADTIYGGGGNDEVYGGSGDDAIYGIKGYNTLFGNDGNDVIHSGRHSSELDGGKGDDRLIADLSKGGDHRMTGGQGADEFVFVSQNETRQSTLVIEDFELGVDRFKIGDEIDNIFLDDGEALSQDGADVLLDLGSGDVIRFENTDLAAFMTEYDLVEPPVFLPVTDPAPIPPLGEMTDLGDALATLLEDFS